MTVRIGKVKTVREILGLKPEDPNITAFAIVRDGHHYSFTEAMNAWGVTKNVCVFIEQTSKSHPHYNFIGTLSGEAGYSFCAEWLEGTFEQEIPDDDPRALFLSHHGRGSGGGGPEEFLKRLLGGAE